MNFLTVGSGIAGRFSVRPISSPNSRNDHPRSSRVSSSRSAICCSVSGFDLANEPSRTDLAVSHDVTIGQYLPSVKSGPSSPLLAHLAVCPDRHVMSCASEMTEDLAGWVESLRPRYGTMRAIAELIGMTESGFTRGVKRGTLSIENLLDLARVTEE